jgi:hypothetical protein
VDNPKSVVLYRTTEMALSFPSFRPHRCGLAAGSPVFSSFSSDYRISLLITFEKCKVLGAHLSLIDGFYESKNSKARKGFPVLCIVCRTKHEFRGTAIMS